MSAPQDGPTARIKVICGRDPAKTREFSARHDLPWSVDYNDVLKNPEIHVVDIVLPSGLHAETGIAAARAGKHVIVEKPIDVTLDESFRILGKVVTWLSGGARKNS